MATRTQTAFDEIDRTIAGFSGRVGLWARNLATGETIDRGGGEVLEGASTIKILVMLEAFRQVAAGELALDEPLVFEERHRVRGSGVVRDLSLGATLSVRDAIVLMMIVSDNVATNMVVDRVGLDRVNAAAAGFDAPDTRLMDRLDFDAHPEAFGVSRTTARDLCAMLALLAEHRAVRPDLDDAMLAILRRQHYTSGLTRHLPYRLVDAAGGREPILQTASKTGSWPGVRNIAGLVEAPGLRYVVGIMTADCADRRAHDDNEAALLLPRLSRLVFDIFAPGELRAG